MSLSQNLREMIESRLTASGFDDDFLPISATPPPPSQHQTAFIRKLPPRNNNNIRSPSASLTTPFVRQQSQQKQKDQKPEFNLSPLKPTQTFTKTGLFQRNDRQLDLLNAKALESKDLLLKKQLEKLKREKESLLDSSAARKKEHILLRNRKPLTSSTFASISKQISPNTKKQIQRNPVYRQQQQTPPKRQHQSGDLDGVRRRPVVDNSRLGEREPLKSISKQRDHRILIRGNSKNQNQFDNVENQQKFFDEDFDGLSESVSRQKNSMPQKNKESTSLFSKLEEGIQNFKLRLKDEQELIDFEEGQKRAKAKIKFVEFSESLINDNKEDDNDFDDTEPSNVEFNNLISTADEKHIADESFLEDKSQHLFNFTNVNRKLNSPSPKQTTKIDKINNFDIVSKVSDLFVSKLVEGTLESIKKKQNIAIGQFFDKEINEFDLKSDAIITNHDSQSTDLQEKFTSISISPLPLQKNPNIFVHEEVSEDEIHHSNIGNEKIFSKNHPNNPDQPEYQYPDEGQEETPPQTQITIHKPDSPTKPNTNIIISTSKEVQILHLQLPRQTIQNIRDEKARCLKRNKEAFALDYELGDVEESVLNSFLEKGVGELLDSVVDGVLDDVLRRCVRETGEICDEFVDLMLEEEFRPV